MLNTFSNLPQGMGNGSWRRDFNPVLFFSVYNFHDELGEEGEENARLEKA